MGRAGIRSRWLNVRGLRGLPPALVDLTTYSFFGTILQIEQEADMDNYTVKEGCVIGAVAVGYVFLEDIEILEAKIAELTK